MAAGTWYPRSTYVAMRCDTNCKFIGPADSSDEGGKREEDGGESRERYGLHDGGCFCLMSVMVNVIVIVIIEEILWTQVVFYTCSDFSFGSVAPKSKFEQGQK